MSGQPPALLKAGTRIVLTPLGRPARSGTGPCLLGVEIRIGSGVVEIECVEQTVRRRARVSDAAVAASPEACEGAALPVTSARFSVSETKLKHLRPQGRALEWRQVEVVKSDGEWREIRTRGLAQRVPRQSGPLKFSLGLKKVHRYAVEVVSATVEGSLPPLRRRPRQATRGNGS